MKIARPTRWLLLFAAFTLAAACGSSAPGDSAKSSAKRTPGANAFTILAGSELKELEPAIVDAAQRAGVEVSMSYAGTLDIVDRINNGEQVDAILPPNGAYPALALTVKPMAREKLFYSRVALGVKASKAGSLGWEAKTPTWAEIARTARAGQFHFAMTNPTSSNTGMSALFAVASAGAHKTEDLAVDEVDSSLLKDFLSGQALTAGSSGWLGDAFLKDPGVVDGLINYEAVLLRLNEKLPATNNLVLIYPTDGVISADYPLMLLNATKRADWQRVVDALKAEPFQRDALQPAYLRPSNPNAAMAAALPKTAVAELAFPNRLDVIDQVLSAYQGEWRRPATSIFVLDVSGSMAGERLTGMRDALKILTGADATTLGARAARFQNRERVVLITFSTEVAPSRTVVFDTAAIEDARATVRDYADALEAGGGTAIYSALTAAEEVAHREATADQQRYVSIVLLTDGENNKGISSREFRTSLARGPSAVRIFPILFGEADAKELGAIAELTGGRTFDARTSALANVFKEIRGYQ